MAIGRRSIHSVKESTRVREYITKKDFLNTITFKILPDGSSGFILNGKLNPADEFLKEHRPILLNLAEINYDKTKNWMHDKKSY